MLNKINRIIIANAENFKDLDINEYLDTVQYCREHELFFLRASESVFPRRIINPKLRPTRKTMYSNNIHEFLIDANPAWDSFPKRSKCLIGIGVKLSSPDAYSPRDFHLSVYGFELYYVFPKNLFSGRVAFIEEEDFLGLLKRKTNYDETYDFYSDIMNLFNLKHTYHFDGMSDFETHCYYVDDNLEAIYKNLDLMELNNNNSYYYLLEFMKNIASVTDSGFVSNLLKIFENLNTLKIYPVDVVDNKTAEIFFTDFIKEVKKCLDVGFKKYLWNIMEPDTCHVLEPSDIDYIDGNEFWTDEKCLLVNANYIREFYNEVENYLK